MLILFVFIKVHGGQLIWCDTLNNFFILISNILLQARKEITMHTYFFYTIIDFWLVESKARVPGLVSTMLQPWTWNSSVVVQRPFVWLSPRPRRPGLDSSNGVIEFFFSHLCGRQFSLWASTYLKIVFFFFFNCKVSKCAETWNSKTSYMKRRKPYYHLFSELFFSLMRPLFSPHGRPAQRTSSSTHIIKPSFYAYLMKPVQAW